MGAGEQDQHHEASFEAHAVCKADVQELALIVAA